MWELFQHCGNNLDFPGQTVKRMCGGVHSGNTGVPTVPSQVLSATPSFTDRPAHAPLLVIGVSVFATILRLSEKCFQGYQQCPQHGCDRSTESTSKRAHARDMVWYISFYCDVWSLAALCDFHFVRLESSRRKIEQKSGIMISRRHNHNAATCTMLSVRRPSLASVFPKLHHISHLPSLKCQSREWLKVVFAL